MSEAVSGPGRRDNTDARLTPNGETLNVSVQAERLTKAIQRNVALAMQIDDLRSVLSRLLANLAQRDDLTDQERVTIAAAAPILRETEPRKRVVEPDDLP